MAVRWLRLRQTQASWELLFCLYLCDLAVKRDTDIHKITDAKLLILKLEILMTLDFKELKTNLIDLGA